MNPLSTSLLQRRKALVREEDKEDKNYGLAPETQSSKQADEEAIQEASEHYNEEMYKNPEESEEQLGQRFMEDYQAPESDNEGLIQRLLSGEQQPKTINERLLLEQARKGMRNGR